MSIIHRILSIIVAVIILAVLCVGASMLVKLITPDDTLRALIGFGIGIVIGPIVAMALVSYWDKFEGMW